MKRYTQYPFPTRKYLPGEGIHPKKDPSGGHDPADLLPSDGFNPQAWQDSDRYLYAVDLFNYGYWWEAHEVLEEIWQSVGPGTQTGLFIQGLIQIAAALIKKTQSVHQGADRLCVKGLAKIRQKPDIFLGIDVRLFSAHTTLFIQGTHASPPIIVLDF